MTATHVCLPLSFDPRPGILPTAGRRLRLTGWRLGYACPGRYDYSRKLAAPASCVNAPSHMPGPALAGLRTRRARWSPSSTAAEDRGEGLNKLPASLLTPRGAFYSFPNIKRTGWKAKKLASALLEETGVAIVGGPDFGILGEGYIRVSYANSTENILKALGRMGEFLASRKAA